MSGTRISNLLGKITIVVIILSCGLPTHAKYGGGTGEPNDPYLIYTAEQMNEIGMSGNSEDLDKCFKLMADINLSAYTGTSFNIIGKFTGVFDGNGKKIFNFTYTSNEKSYIGLFGSIEGENAVIRDLGLIDPNVDAGSEDFVGSLVAYLENGSISNCYVEGGSASGDRYIGGLVGYSYDGDIADCYAKGSVFGDRYVGGLVGYNDNSIVDCYTSGNVTGGDDSYCVGGLCGKSTGPDHGTVQSSIQNCYSTATVTGYWSAGGLIGHSGAIVTGCYSRGSASGFSHVGGLIGRNGGNGRIINCYSTGGVVGEQSYGGLVGSSEGTVSASFWDIETSGQTTSDGGAGLTTVEMQMASTFVCWGYEPVWTIDEGVDYPRLVWENQPGELITVPSDLYGGGSGEAEDPFLIYTAQQLNMIGLNTCHLDKHFRLMADVDLGSFTGTSFNIIGIDYDNPFSGVFNGNDRKIFNFTYNSTGGYEIGLFRYVGPNAEIRNLGLIDPNVDVGTGDYVGSLVGELREGTVSNCYIKGGGVSGDDTVGGLVGNSYHGKITNSYSTCSVSGDCDVGGLVGYCYRVTIDNSFSSASVSGDRRVGGLVGYDYRGTIGSSYSSASVSGDQYVGGLVGRENRGTIADSYSTCSVSGGEVVGGLVGEDYKGRIAKSYSTGSVLAEQYVGGLVGSNSDGIFTNCYSKGSVEGENTVGGLAGFNVSGTITNSFSTAGVSGIYVVGGLVAGNEDGTITNCYSKGSVSGDCLVAGLAGSNEGTITNCYSTGSVIGNSDFGGLVGLNYGSITASFWNVETSGQTTSAGGTGLTTDQMQMQITFTDAGWDFVGEAVNGIDDIWFIGQQDYPHLWWEGMQSSMKLTPRKLNCRSEGNWVKARLILPGGFTVADVDSNKPAVLHSFGFQSDPLYVFINEDELVEIEAAFERRVVCSLAGDWPDELTVAGFLTDGNIFLGTSTIRIKHPGMKVIEELAMYWLNENCDRPVFCDGIDMNRDSVVNLPDYALLLNSQVEFVTDK